MRFTILALLLLTPALASASAPADALQFTKEQFSTYCAFKNFMAEDGEWKKFKTPERAKKKFAKNYRMKEAALDALITAGERVGSCADFKARWEADLKAALKAIPKRGDLVRGFKEPIFARRINWVEVNVDNSDHVIVWVSWLWFNDRFVEEESAIVGAIVHEVLPAAGTLLVFARKKSEKEKNMFEAKISGSRLGTIKLKKVGDYAKKRYWRFFEGIKFDESISRTN
ncbi:MAG: hypothetical protein CMH55_00150 [Myxococcales bacterium]|nr:hypothetical protein [Myxococcales bacterium]